MASAMLLSCFSCGASQDDPNTGGGELSEAFLDLLAGTSGDAAVAARTRAEVLLAASSADSIRECMSAAGFSEYADIPVLQAEERNAVHSEFASPTQLERRGIVSVSNPELDAVPAEAVDAAAECAGETDSGRAAAREAQRFIRFRDSAENPFEQWPGVFRKESAAVGASNDPAVVEYRECLRRLGVPEDFNATPTMAMNWMIGEANEGATDVSAEAIQGWQDGSRVLDADGGAMARGAANCFRLFETVLEPRLEAARRDVVESQREQLLEGQELFFAAIGSESFATESVP